MRQTGVAMLVTALVAVPLTAAAAPYVGPSSVGSPTIHTLPAPHGVGGSIIGAAANGWVATTQAVWTGIGYPTPPAFPDPTVTGSQYAIDDINNLGVAAGTYRSATGFDRGFVWTPGGAFVDVGTPAGSNGSFVRVTGIDDERRVVGTFAAAPGVCSPGGATCGFFGEPKADGTYSLVPLGPNNAQFFPQDIGGGLVVGPGWIWDVEQDTWTPLEGPVAGSTATGWSVNEVKQIAGDWIPVQGTTEALFWAGPQGAPTRLGALAGDTLSRSNGIGEDGTVAGWSATASTGARRGWIWKGAGLIELGHIPGETATSEAFDVQGDLVVGTASGRAVFWDLGGTLDIDYPPEITPSSPLIRVPEGGLVEFVPTITDFDGDSFTVDCAGLPAGASCDPDTGVLTWQTAVGDAGTYTPTMTATQDGTAANAQTITVRIEVAAEFALLDIPDQTATVGEQLTFTAEAVGASGTVTYGYSPSITGASIDQFTGVFTWTPTADQVGDQTITVAATDSGSRQTVSQSVAIRVVEAGDPPPPVVITVSEAVGVSDVVTVVVDAPVAISVTEAIGVTDAVAVRPPVVITIGETIGVGDVVQVRPPVKIAITEAVGVVDAVVVTGDAPVVITVAEAIGVVDTAAVRPPVVISLTEAIGVGDAVSVAGPVTVESILAFLASLDDDDFRRGDTGRRILERLITVADRSADATDAALARVDGCGEVADRNDLIVECQAQREVRRLLTLLREQLLNEE
jgi:hypothetical protein